MTDYSKRGSFEAKTHELLDFDRPGTKLVWSPTAALVAKVFKAEWISSLPLAKIQEIAAAFGPYEGVETDWLQHDLDAMVKAKVLRRRTLRGVKHYEVNY